MKDKGLAAGKPYGMILGLSTATPCGRMAETRALYIFVLVAAHNGAAGAGKIGLRANFPRSPDHAQVALADVIDAGAQVEVGVDETPKVA